MKVRRRLVSFILINIFVSATVTGMMIYFYNQSHLADCNIALPGGTTALPGAASINVNIIGVIGVGTLTDEQVIIRNDSADPVVLTGWYLVDNKGVSYTFPQLTIFHGAKVQVHTESGSNNASDLYWGRTAPIWSSGELVVLYDAKNIARAFYRIP